MYDNKYTKTNIRIYNNRINTNFYGNKIPEDNECCTCLSVILLDYVVVVDKKYHRQIFLKDFKYLVKNKEIVSTINEELNLHESDDESHEKNANIQ